MIDLTPIAEAVITLVSVVITAFIIPWIKTKISAAKYAEIEKWVTIAVNAAEMVYSGAGLGNLKKEYVEKFLAEKGYKIDVKSIDAMIEAAVLEIQKK